MSKHGKAWEWEINARTTDWSWNIRELLSYRHLLFSLVRRDFLLSYQQTLLGPVWVLFQPIVTLITYVLVFGKLIGVSIGTLPPVLFYFSGIILWNFFQDSFTDSSGTFKQNMNLFSKVYFPRIIMPVSAITTQFLRFSIQLVLLILLITYYVIFKNFHVHLGIALLGVPLAFAGVGLTSLSLGLVFSILTAKYRDLSNMVSLITRLLMFVTPVIYPLASVPHDLHWVVVLNPLTSFFELFRLSLLGEGTVVLPYLAYSIIFTIIIFPAALWIFNKNGNKLIDVI
jgi:lipopolysaccharide transport system permease protein